MTEENDDNEEQRILSHNLNRLRDVQIAPRIYKSDFKRGTRVTAHSFLVHSSGERHTVDSFLRELRQGNSRSEEERLEESLQDRQDHVEEIRVKTAVDTLMTITTVIRLSWEIASAKRTTARIYKPPGHMLVATLRFVLPKKVFERVVEQMILDAREEHAEALAEGRLRHARWIAMRLYILVGMALGWDWLTWPLHKLTQFWQKD